MQWLTDLTNNPTFIAIVTVLTSAGSVLLALSKTSFGKKAIKYLTEKADSTAQKVDAEINILEDKVRLLDEQKTAFINELDTKFKVYFEQFSFYESQMIEILECIPNVKVQEKVVALKEEWANKKKEIEVLIGLGSEEIENKMKELELQVQELMEKLQNGGYYQKEEE